MTEETATLLGWDFCFLAHRLPEREELRILVYIDTVGGRKRVYAGEVMSPGDFSGPVVRVLEGKPVLINRVPGQAGPTLKPAGSKRLSKSLMFAPVRCGRRVIGLITAQSYTTDRYQPGDLRLLRQIADMVAPALERVYAEEALRRAHRELEARVKQRTAELKAANARLRRETRERKTALEAVRASEKRFRALTVEMDRRLESERARIARELHDHLGQVLTAVNMNLAWLERKTAEGDGAVNSRIAECIGQVSQMTGLIRSLCKSLHPVVLDHHGLIEAIKTQVSEFQQYSQVRCDLTVRPVDLEVSKPVAIVAFRIVQEALTNVARHSGAKRCQVALRGERSRLVLTVRDNGRGAPAARLSGTRSLGILGMKERASAAGGTLKIENAPGGGVRMQAELPL